MTFVEDNLNGRLFYIAGTQLNMIWNIFMSNVDPVWMTTSREDNLNGRFILTAEIKLNLPWNIDNMTNNVHHQKVNKSMDFSSSLKGK